MLKLLKSHQYLLKISRPLVGTHRVNLKNNEAGSVRRFSQDDSTKSPDSKTKQNITAVTSKFEVFRDEDATIILDVEEEREKLNSVIETEESIVDAFAGLNLERK